MYMFGIGGVKISYPHAEKLFNQSANCDNSDSIVNLGLMYDETYGAYKRSEIAYGYFLKASHLGNCRAYRYIANYYYSGKIVDKDLV